MTVNLIVEHLTIVVAAGVLAVAIGLPLGVVAYLYKGARGIILWVADLLQTIPSLALLGIIMVFLGAGKLTVILGITLYSLLPIVRNTCLGLQEVDPAIREAARGMGMGKLYRTLYVEFPLAFPMVFTGIRIAVVNAIGSAVFAAFVGGGGLGTAIYRGIRVQNMSLILTGTATLMVIAVIFDLLMGGIEKHLNQGRRRSSRD
ncbi:MAG: ABC transporter permease [Oscillospiraceae bacterium]